MKNEIYNLKCWLNEILQGQAADCTNWLGGYGLFKRDRSWKSMLYIYYTRTLWHVEIDCGIMKF